MEYVTIESEQKRLKIGVVGYSAKKYDTNKAFNLLKVGIRKILRDHKLTTKDIEIVSGLTNVGIPGQIYFLAKQNDIYTVGIACKKAKDYPIFPVDKKIIVGEDWGDESKTFLKYIDVMLKVGGGDQSNKEAHMCRIAGKKVYEYDLPLLE